MLSKYYELGIQIDLNLHTLKEMDHSTIIASTLILETADLLLERYKIANQEIREFGNESTVN